MPIKKQTLEPKQPAAAAPSRNEGTVSGVSTVKPIYDESGKEDKSPKNSEHEKKEQETKEEILPEVPEAEEKVVVEEEPESFDFLSALGNVFDGAMDILDKPNQWIGSALDGIYDNTIGELTGTRDLFTGDDAAWVPRILSMFIPGAGVGAGMKAVGSLRNLKNIDKFENAVSNVMNAKRFKETPETFANSINGKIAAYAGRDGYSSALQAKLPDDLMMTGNTLVGKGRKYLGKGNYDAEKRYILANEKDLRNGSKLRNGVTDRWGDPIYKARERYDDFTPIGMDATDAQRLVEENAIRTNVPLYRGGYRNDGTYWTPDARLANSYKKTTDGRAASRGFDGSKLWVMKGPKDTSPGLMTGSSAKYKGPMARETFVGPYMADRNSRKVGPIENFMTPNLDRRIDRAIDNIVTKMYKSKK